MMIKPIIFFLIVLIAGCSSLQKTEQTKELMGTYVTITVYGQEKAAAEGAIGKSYDEIRRIEGLLSNYVNTSEVYILNREGSLDSASNELIYVLGKSLRYGDLSGGAFDITVQPILDLYADSFNELGRPPTGDEIKDVRKLVGYEKIVVRNNNIKLMDGMKITLGGIAKGYIIDKAVDALKKKGVEHALVNAGGDMRAIGNKGRESWQIALQNPRDRKKSITVVPLDDNAVATSGDYERYFDDSRKFHHIVDPRSGYSATELISVTITAKTALEADALATSVFVLGVEEGLGLIESIDNVEGLLITKDKEIVRSSGFEY